MQLFSVIKERRLPLIKAAAQRMMEERNEKPAKIYIEIDNIKEDTGISSPDKSDALTRDEKEYCGII